MVEPYGQLLGLVSITEQRVVKIRTIPLDRWRHKPPFSHSPPSSEPQTGSPTDSFPHHFSMSRGDWNDLYCTNRLITFFPCALCEHTSHFGQLSARPPKGIQEHD